MNICRYIERFIMRDCLRWRLSSPTIFCLHQGSQWCSSSLNLKFEVLRIKETGAALSQGKSSEKSLRVLPLPFILFRLPALERAFFTHSTDSAAYLFWKHPDIMFYQLWASLSLARLTYKVNHQSICIITVE